MDLHYLRNLPADHIDLLMTSGISFGVISAPPGTPRLHRVLAAVAQRLGTGLFLRNSVVDPAGYRYRPVEGPLDVRDVLKACHAAQFAYRQTPLWVGSNEQRVIDGVAKAAAMRTPGYELSPWVWTRPVENAVGFAPIGSWRPAAFEGVEWIDNLEDFTLRWSKARIVILTPTALKHLPTLSVRPRVYLIVEADHAAAAILAADRHKAWIDSVLMWPQAEQWLRTELLI